MFYNLELFLAQINNCMFISDFSLSLIYKVYKKYD